MTRNKWQHKLAVWMVIPAMFLLFHNRVSNWHYHLLHNGMIVEHAHPFSNSREPGTPYQNHQHSDKEYQVLAQLYNALTWLVVLALAMGGLLMRHARKPIGMPALVFVTEPSLTSRTLRAPPLFLV